MDSAAPVSTGSVSLRGLRFRVVVDGPSSGQPVLLLHGFPEASHGWRRQIPELAARGFRVWAPDQRGCGGSQGPPGVAPYALRELVQDAAAFVQSMTAAGTHERAVVVGHDWGAAVAWGLALAQPERISHLVPVNVPHPLVMRRALLRDPRQMLRSWYIALFQVPWLPEALLRARDHALLRRTLRNSSRPGTFDDDLLARSRAAWDRPGGLTPALNWYRALLRHPPRIPAPRVRVPTLLLWGARDRFLRRALADASLEWCDNGHLEVRDDATHWVQHEHPIWVSDQIARFAVS